MSERFELSAEEKGHLLDAVPRFSDCRIMVLGDVMLDVFIWGEVSRISPEAPVPVVEVREETRLLGGSANVVNNVAALGGRVSVSSVIGSDLPGRELVTLLRRMKVPTDGLIVENDRPTTTKTRIIAHNQQVVRYDRELRRPVTGESLEQVLSHIRENLDRTDGIIISDYGKGTITRDLMDGIRSLNLASSMPVIVDPKINHTELYRRVTMVTPNHHEASRMSGIEIRDDDSLDEAGRTLIDRLECPMVLITRGRDGMSMFFEDSPPVHIPTVARRVFDVTGAGDTVIAALTLGMVAGLPPVEAAMLANLAAGIVVGEVGTATVSADRLLSVIRDSCIT